MVWSQHVAQSILAAYDNLQERNSKVSVQLYICSQCVCVPFGTLASLECLHGRNHVVVNLVLLQHRLVHGSAMDENQCMNTTAFEDKSAANDVPEEGEAHKRYSTVFTNHKAGRCLPLIAWCIVHTLS